MTTIHTRKLQYTQDSYNNTHKTTNNNTHKTTNNNTHKTTNNNTHTLYRSHTYWFSTSAMDTVTRLSITISRTLSVCPVPRCLYVSIWPFKFCFFFSPLLSDLSRTVWITIMFTTPVTMYSHITIGRGSFLSEGKIVFTRSLDAQFTMRATQSSSFCDKKDFNIQHHSLLAFWIE